MFATQYCVTPTKRANQPMGRMQERACTFLRDVKRRSLRVKRSKSLVINPKSEKRKSGKTQNSQNDIILESQINSYLGPRSTVDFKSSTTGI